MILATTEIQKLPETIISRCQRYSFKRIPLNSIKEYLKIILSKEGFEFEDSALTSIALKADGSMRDCLSIFDQLIAFSDGEITNELAIKMLGVIPSDLFFNINGLNESNYLVLLSMSPDLSLNDIEKIITVSYTHLTLPTKRIV
mgnify:CR=1 FL=1